MKVSIYIWCDAISSPQFSLSMAGVKTRRRSDSKLSQLVGPGKEFIPSEVPTLQTIIQRGILIRDRMLLEQGSAKTDVHIKDIVLELVFSDSGTIWQISNAKIAPPVTIKEGSITYDKGQRWIGCGGRWRRLNTEEQGKGRVEVKGKGRWKGTRSSFSWTNWWTSPPAPTAFSSATILGLDAKMGAPSCPWSMRWDALQPWVQGVARGRGPYLHTRGSVKDNEHRPAYVLHSGGGRQEGDATQGDARDTLWASLPCQVCHKCNSSMQQLSYNGAYPHL